jgi:hypothetical protein
MHIVRIGDSFCNSTVVVDGIMFRNDGKDGRLGMVLSGISDKDLGYIQLLEY